MNIRPQVFASEFSMSSKKYYNKRSRTRTFWASAVCRASSSHVDWLLPCSLLVTRRSDTH